MTNCGCTQAVAYLRGDDTCSNLRGKVTFTAKDCGTLVTAEICGLPDSDTGFFAFHIHEGSNCCGEGFPNTGGHFNPCDTDHPKHAGDLPPLLSCNGKAYLAVLTCLFRISDILGRTVVIHSGPDDFKTQPAGDAGEKIACGIIRRA